MAKNSSTSFFGAAGWYDDFNSTAFAQQLTKNLSGNESQQQEKISNINIIDANSQKASQEIDALAQETKKDLNPKMSSGAFAAIKSRDASKKTSLFITNSTNNSVINSKISDPRVKMVEKKSAETTNANQENAETTKNIETNTVTDTMMDDKKINSDTQTDNSNEKNQSEIEKKVLEYNFNDNDDVVLTNNKKHTNKNNSGAKSKPQKYKPK